MTLRGRGASRPGPLRVLRPQAAPGLRLRGPEPGAPGGADPAQLRPGDLRRAACLGAAGRLGGDPRGAAGRGGRPGRAADDPGPVAGPAPDASAPRGGHGGPGRGGRGHRLLRHALLGAARRRHGARGGPRPGVAGDGRGPGPRPGAGLDLRRVGAGRGGPPAPPGPLLGGDPGGGGRAGGTADGFRGRGPRPAGGLAGARVVGREGVSFRRRVVLAPGGICRGGRGALGRGAGRRPGASLLLPPRGPDVPGGRPAGGLLPGLRPAGPSGSPSPTRCFCWASA